MTSWDRCSDCGLLTEGHGSPEHFCRCPNFEALRDKALEALGAAAIAHIDIGALSVVLTDAARVFADADRAFRAHKEKRRK